MHELSRRAVELTKSLEPRPEISHVVFDFDGTLSWLRHGWPQIMLSVFHEYLPRWAYEAPEDYERPLNHIVLGMNGTPSILQMVEFTKLARAREEKVPDAESLRQEFQHKLDLAIAARIEKIRSGEATSDDYVVFGGKALLQELQRSGLKMAVISSSLQERVMEEAEVLQITEFFDGRIYGSIDPATFSKADVFGRFTRDARIRGEHLLSFGDGPVETIVVKQLGGIAVAVCSDEEHNGSGIMDPTKRDMLMDAGADAAIPDFRDAIALTDYLRGK